MSTSFPDESKPDARSGLDIDPNLVPYTDPDPEPFADFNVDSYTNLKPTVEVNPNVDPYTDPDPKPFSDPSALLNYKTSFLISACQSLSLWQFGC